MDQEGLYRSVAFGAMQFVEHAPEPWPYIRFSDEDVEALAVRLMIEDGAIKGPAGAILGRMRDTGMTLLQVLNEGNYWNDSLASES